MWEGGEEYEGNRKGRVEGGEKGRRGLRVYGSEKVEKNSFLFPLLMYRLKVTRKIPFISVHLVEPPKKIACSEACSEDILPCIDLKEEESEGRGKERSSSGGNWAKSVQGVLPGSVGVASCHGVSQESELISKLKPEDKGGRRRGGGGGAGSGKKRRNRLMELESGEKTERKPSQRGRRKCHKEVYQKT